MRYILIVTLLLLTACNTTQVIDTGFGIARASNTSPKILEKGIKEALILSSERALQTLSQPGAFSSSSYRIGLPEQFNQTTSLMKQFGFSKQVSRIENLMNQSVELAAAKSQSLLVDTIRTMAIDDAIGIVRGGESSATDYFERKTSESLKQQYRSIVAEQLKKVGYYQEYQQFLGLYQKLPLVQKPDLNIEGFLAEKSLQPMFVQMAREERLIRQDPVGKGSELIALILRK